MAFSVFEEAYGVKQRGARGREGKVPVVLIKAGPHSKREGFLKRTAIPGSL